MLADSPNYFWRMNEASGTTAYDRAGSDDMVLNTATAAGRNISGALLNESDAATNFPGTSSTGTNPGVSPFWQSGPQTFTLETWLRTQTTNGGKIIGFGNTANGRSDSNNNDRNLYMNNAGQIYFGVRPDMGTRVTINSPSAYRDNQWHHVVATLGADGMKLYVDGNQVAANANVKKAQVYRGYWRIGSDRLSSWPSDAEPGSHHRQPRRDRGLPDGALGRPHPGALPGERPHRHVPERAAGRVVHVVVAVPRRVLRRGRVERRRRFDLRPTRGTSVTVDTGSGITTAAHLRRRAARTTSRSR